MLNNFIPDIYQKSIYDIDYKKLKKNGIKCLIFDLDNTIAPINIKKPTKKIKDLFEILKDMNFKVIIVSNSLKKRVEPFKDILGVDSAYLSCKPLKRKYLKILKIYHLKDSQIACIGDQLLTDIWGANRMSFVSILVNPIGTTDYALTKINRFIEPFIYQKLLNRDLLKKGEYYE
jgi:hypothetical protein